MYRRRTGTVMNRKTVNIFFQSISVLLIAMLAITAYYSLFAKGLDSLYIGSVSDYPMAYILFAVLFLGAVFFAGFGLIDRHAEKWHTLIFWGIMGITLAAQLAILFGFRVYQITDGYIVQDQARALALGTTDTINVTNINYFLIYGNNYFLLYFFYAYYKISQFLHIQDDAFVLAALNVIFLDLALVFEYRTACLLTNRKTALKIHLLTAVNPFSAVLLYWAYTLNYSIPLMAAAGYLIVVLYKKTSLKWYQNVCLSVLLGCVVVWGYYMRPTAVFPFIAGLMCAGLLFVRRCSGEYLKTFPWKRLLPIVISLILAMGVNYVGIHKMFQRFEVDSSRNFPVTHWVMMGLHGDGAFLQEDEVFTNSFASTEEMKEANIAEIKETLKEYGITGLSAHLLVKIRMTWSDGISAYQDRLRASDRIGGLFPYVVGVKRDVLGLYMLAYRTLTLILSIVGVAHLMKKKKPDGSFLITLTLFGGYFFYLLWEAKAVYSVPFLYCLGYLGGISAEPLQERFLQIRRKAEGRINGLSVFFAALLIFSMVLSVAHYQDYLISSAHQNLSIHMGSGQFMRYVSNLKKSGKELTQDFYISKPVSYISIPVKTLNGDAVYQMVLTNSAGDVVASMDAGKSDISNNYLNWKFKEYTPSSEEEQMHISVRALSGASDSIGFPYRFSQGLSQYDGERALDGVVQNGDLYMSVISYEKYPIASKKGYLIFWFLIFAAEGFGIWFCSRRISDEMIPEEGKREPKIADEKSSEVVISEDNKPTE